MVLRTPSGHSLVFPPKAAEVECILARLLLCTSAETYRDVRPAVHLIAFLISLDTPEKAGKEKAAEIGK